MTSVLALLAGLAAAHTIGPTGFYNMCAVLQAECRPAAQTRSVSFDEVVWINQSVNRDIRVQPERDGADVWLIGPQAGDCDDYVMTKRHYLISAGLGSDRARVAVGVAKGQLHAVLIVTVGSTYYVLDNLTDAVLPVERSAVSILSVQSPENPRIWLKVPGGPVATGQPVAAQQVSMPPRR